MNELNSSWNIPFKLKSFAFAVLTHGLLTEESKPNYGAVILITNAYTLQCWKLERLQLEKNTSYKLRAHGTVDS
jgi:hypothetical protein